MRTQDTYFKTLHAALNHAVVSTNARGFDIKADDLFRAFGTGGVNYGETRKGHLPLWKAEKAQRKMLQISIYRMDSGTYELTHYIN